MISPNVHCETESAWALGRIYHDYLELGYRESEIAKLVGRSQSTISRYVHVFRGLHAETVKLLESLAAPPNILLLGKLARLRTCDDEPDFDRQRKALSKIVAKRVARRR